MNSKRGSAGEWLLMILIILVVGAISVYLSMTLTYSKSEVEELLSNYSQCELVQLNNGADNGNYRYEVKGKTPQQVCSDIGKEVKFLFKESYHDIYWGDTAENCDTYRKNDIAFGVTTSRFADPSEFDKTLSEETPGTCRGVGGRMSISNEWSIYKNVMCC